MREGQYAAERTVEPHPNWRNAVTPIKRYEKQNEQGEPGFVYETRLPWNKPGALADVVQEMSGGSDPAEWQAHLVAIAVMTKDGTKDGSRSYTALWVPQAESRDAEERLIAHEFSITSSAASGGG